MTGSPSEIFADHELFFQRDEEENCVHECVRGALKEDQHKTNTLNV